MKKSVINKVFVLICFILFYSCKMESKEVDLFNEKSISAVSFNDFQPNSTSNQVVVHENYTLSYLEKFEQSEWVAYTLKKENLKGNNYKRPYFIEDDKVSTKSADWRNYRKSGYDKGHLCPAGDMKFSKEAYDDTFLTSNISPQKHDFNSGLWNRLEQKTRYWAEKYNEVYVVSGGILTSGLKTIGSEKVAVPNYFYKIIARETNNEIKIIAFLVPHKKSNQPLYKFVTSVDEIEKLTHIDFFPKLEDTLENKLEQNIDYKDWSFN
jgi:endonuclease G, mitochondrial